MTAKVNYIWRKWSKIGQWCCTCMRTASVGKSISWIIEFDTFLICYSNNLNMIEIIIRSIRLYTTVVIETWMIDIRFVIRSVQILQPRAPSLEFIRDICLRKDNLGKATLLAAWKCLLEEMHSHSLKIIIPHTTQTDMIEQFLKLLHFISKLLVWPDRKWPNSSNTKMKAEC